VKRKITGILFWVFCSGLFETASLLGKTSEEAPFKSLQPLPDFVITKAVVTDANKGSIKVTVKNRGTGDGKNCRIRLKISSKDGSQLLKTIEQNQLPIKTGAELIIDLQAETPLWNKKFTVDTDSARTVKESNENNNQFSGQVSN